MDINFVNITPDNWRLFNALRVKEEQKSFVATNVGILAKAFAYREYNSRVYGICYGDKPIGLLMQRDYEKSPKKFCILEQFMIDEKYQGKGFGKEALKLWLDMVKKEAQYHSISLCYIEGDEIARSLYLQMGFYHTGEADEDEIIMEYPFEII